MVYFARIDVGVIPSTIGSEHRIYLIKIGHTSLDPMARIYYLRNTTRQPAELLATMPGDETTEAELHRRFGHLRIMAFNYKNQPPEWFYPTRELMEFIEGIPGSVPVKPVKYCRKSRCGSAPIDGDSDRSSQESRDMLTRIENSFREDLTLT